MFGKRTEETGGNNHHLRFAENTDFILQPVEIHARLSAHSGIDSTQQCGRHIDKTHAALERGSGKTSKVGHHTPTEINHYRAACSSPFLQFLPHMAERIQVLVHVAGRYLYDGCILDESIFRKPWQHFPTCIFIGQHKHAVGLHAGKQFRQGLRHMVSKQQFLMFHCLSLLFRQPFTKFNQRRQRSRKVAHCRVDDVRSVFIHDRCRNRTGSDAHRKAS